MLEVNVDRELCFDLHLQTIAQQALLQVSTMRRVAAFLDRRGKLMLYKAQIRSYGVLTWMSSVATRLRKLDKVERQIMSWLMVPHPSHYRT